MPFDRAIRFYNQIGDTLLVFPVESPETCPQCRQRRCIFLERRPRSLCLACASPVEDLEAA